MMTERAAAAVAVTAMADAVPLDGGSRDVALVAVGAAALVASVLVAVRVLPVAVAVGVRPCPGLPQWQWRRPGRDGGGGKRKESVADGQTVAVAVTMAAVKLAVATVLQGVG